MTSLGKLSGSRAERRRSAAAAARSVPGARPRPRSMRPGNNASSVPNCSATRQRRMVGQHDAAGADANARCARPDVREEHRRRRAGDTRHVVVLGHPEAPVAQALGMLRDIARPAKGVGGGAPFENGGEIEDRKRDHRFHRYTDHPARPGWCSTTIRVDWRRLRGEGAVMALVRHVHVGLKRIELHAFVTEMYAGTEKPPEFPRRDGQELHSGAVNPVLRTWAGARKFKRAVKSIARRMQ